MVSRGEKVVTSVSLISRILQGERGARIVKDTGKKRQPLPKVNDAKINNCLWVSVNGEKCAVFFLPVTLAKQSTLKPKLHTKVKC